MRYILTRLTEQSTWVGIGTLLAGVGIAIEPALWERIIAACAAIAGVGVALTRDKVPTIKPKE